MKRRKKIKSICESGIIRKLANDCQNAERQLAAERGAADFIVSAIYEVDEEGCLNRDAVELALRERLHDMATVLEATRQKRHLARVLEVADDGIVLSFAERCHDVLQKLAAEATPRSIAALAVAEADQGGLPIREATAVVLHGYLRSLDVTLKNIRESKAAWGTGCVGCQHWQEIDGALSCEADVTWASGSAPLNPYCHTK